MLCVSIINRAVFVANLSVHLTGVSPEHNTSRYVYREAHKLTIQEDTDGRYKMVEKGKTNIENCASSLPY
jgi:YD repeat-containing protein